MLLSDILGKEKEQMTNIQDEIVGFTINGLDELVGGGIAKKFVGSI